MSKADIQELVIDGKTYVPKDQLPNVEGDVKIVVLQRGWVFVGRLEQDGEDCVLNNAFNIRRWGTTYGLGQLALEGPQSNTALDKAGVVHFNELTAVVILDCVEDKWASKL